MCAITMSTPQRGRSRVRNRPPTTMVDETKVPKTAAVPMDVAEAASKEAVAVPAASKEAVTVPATSKEAVAVPAVADEPTAPKRKRLVVRVESKRDDISLKDRVAADPKFNELKVSSNTETKRLAGALAHIAREQREMKISALSPANINTAVKAVAVARDYVKDESIDVGIVLKFRDDSRRALEMRYVTFDSRYTVPDESNPTYSVGKSTNSSASSGAVAARVREGARPVLSCIGAGSVFRAMTAICLASEYIRRETEGKNELMIIPYFVNVSKGDESVTTLNMCVIKIDV
jgi:stage V sporulation protein SpoVS